MPLRQTLQWMLVLLATIVIVAGGGLIWLWGQSDRILKSQIAQGLEKFAPELPIDFKRASLETDGRVRLVELKLLTPDHSSTLVRLPELVTYLDRDLFVQHRQISIQRVVVNHPQVTLDQAADGTWSFEGIKFPKPAGMAWPSIEILDGDILLRVHRDALIPIELRLTNLDAKLKPTARGQCHIEGHGDVDPLGPMEILGDLDTATGRWNLTIQAQKIPAGDKLIGVATDLSPRVRTQVQTIAQVIQEKTRLATPPPEGIDQDIQVASLENQPQQSPGSEKTLIPNIGLRADLFALCTFRCEGSGEPVDYAVDLLVEHGEITDLFPISLHDVSGRLRLTRSELMIDELKASNGQSQLIVNGTMPLNGNFEPPNLTLRASNLPIDRSIREHLPGAILKLYDLLQPEGDFDIDLKYSPEASPPVVLKEFRVRNGSMMHDLFRYRVKSINGTIVQTGDQYVFNMQGLASGQEAVLTGAIRNPGPRFEADLRVLTPGLPIDDVLISAFETPKLKAVAAALRQLRIRGAGDVDVSFRKHPDWGPKFKTFLVATVKNCELNYVRFPIPLSQVSGRIEFDPTRDNIWYFKNLRGNRGETLITGAGQYVVQEGGRLGLMLNAQGVPIDATLKAACLTASDRLQEVWNQLNPTAGHLTCERVSIDWRPGQPPAIRLPDIQVTGAALQLKAVPYPLDRVQGRVSWDGQTVDIHHAEGWHGSTVVEIPTSDGESTSYFQLNPAAGIDWRLHFPRIGLRKIFADEVLRSALPISIRSVVTQLDPRGPLELDLALDLKQFRAPDPTITASFTLDTTLQGNRVTTGINLDDVTGRISIIKGSWDGQTVTAEGYAKLDRARVWGLPLTNLEGPFCIMGQRITVGKPSPGNRAPYSEENPYGGRELAASLYDGKISVNSETLVDPNSASNTKYDAEINVRDARLELWAREQGSRQRLNGPVNGYMSFHGRGPSAMDVEGNGWVQITQAQLYELPVLVKIFTMPDFRSPDNKAFKYAYADFRLHNGLFDFTKIQLVGDAISLVGRGYVGIAGERDRQIDFDFYTDARNKVPLIEPLIRRVASRWVWIRVDGTLDMPSAVMQTRVPILDDVFRGLIKGIENGQFQTPPNPPMSNHSRRTLR